MGFNEGKLKPSEGEMFGNPYGENDYNVPGHEDEYLNKNDYSGKTFSTKKFETAEDVVDEGAESGIYKQFEGEDLSPEESADREAQLKDLYDDETEFMRKAINKLDAVEFNTLFSFLKSIDENGERQYYIGSRDDKGDFISPIKSFPRDICDLIKKVNGQEAMIHSLEHVYDEDGEYLGSNQESVKASSIKFKAPKPEK